MTKTFSMRMQRRKAVRDHILSCYCDYPNEAEAMLIIKLDMQAGNCGDNRQHTNYEQACYLVDCGCFLCYFNDVAAEMKSWGYKKPENMSLNRLWNLYKQIIAFEICSMLRENGLC